MKKRLFCLFLCLVMLGSLVLTSCSNKSEDEATEDIEKEASESALTLTMWIVSEEKVSDAAAAAVSDALNSITRSKFKTALVLKYMTEEEYRSTLEATITAYEETKKNEVSVETEAPAETESGEQAEVTDETMTNEFGMTVIKYPELIANQVDIIYISGEDMYIDFIDAGWLAELDTELSSSSKKIKEYVSSTLLSAAKYNGTTYAIPNNRVIGEYTYMLLNKELMAKYAQDAYAKLSMIDGFYDDDLYSFLNLVHKFEPNVIPLDMNEEFNYQFYLDMLAHYWYIDSADYSIQLNKFSMFGYHYDNIKDLTRGSTVLGYNSLFEDADFVEDYLQLNRFRMDDYFGDATEEGKTAAVKFVKGSYADLAQYEDDYYSVVVQYPTASSSDIYDNMFGVCKYSRNVSRSMEIITYLNTNAEFRNLLQYGIENVHYEVKEDDQGNFIGIHRLTKDYNMTLDATGNMFIAYPDTENDMTADIWESGKVQNRSSLVNPLLGLDFAAYSATTGAAQEALTINKDKGYNLSYSTGYSKDVLSQNTVLANWITGCDNAGKGVYVLKTFVTEGQNVTINYYVYNNNLTKNATFKVEEIRDVEIIKDEKGKETEKQTNLDFILTYADASGKSNTPGYELSLVSLYTKKTNEFELLCKTNDADTAIQVQDMNSLLTFDFMNTKQYSIEEFNGLTQTMVLKNETLMTWMGTTKSGAKPEAHSLKYEGEAVNGKKEYTFVLFRRNLKYVNTVDVQPTGNNGELVVNFNITQDEEDQCETTESKYVLTYVRVTADENVNVSYKVTVNGKDEKTTEKVAETDPDFTLLGNLDTELVKYLQKLNDTMVAFIEDQFTAIYNNYHTKLSTLTGTPDEIRAKKSAALNDAMAEFEAVIKEVGYLMTTDEVAPVYSTKRMEKIHTSGVLETAGLIMDDRTTENIPESATVGALNLLHRYVLNAVAKDPLKITYIEVDENTDKEVEKEANYGGANGEPYVYFTSPYGIYHSWLEKYGFLPKK